MPDPVQQPPIPSESGPQPITSPPFPPPPPAAATPPVDLSTMLQESTTHDMAPPPSVPPFGAPPGPIPPPPPPSPGVQDVPPVISPSPKRSKAKIVGAILGLFVLLSGIGAGVFLVNRPQEVREEAALEETAATTQCQNIKAYNASWTQLNAGELRKLQAGDSVRFAVAGTTQSGSLDKARFRVNEGQWQETTTKNPNGEFYIVFTIPPRNTSFKIEAMIHHQGADRWF